MDFPSANTFGLLPSRRTAIALSHQAISELANRLELFLLEAETDEEADEGGGLEVIFEPWDDELDSYIVAGMTLDDGEEDDEDWQAQLALLAADDDGEDDEDDDDDDDDDDEEERLC